GLLSGKYKGGIPEGSRLSMKQLEWLRGSILTPDRVVKVNELEPIARELDCTMAQLALAWCLTRPFVSSVITGASRVEQVRENLGALEVVPRITPAVLQRIDAILGNDPNGTRA